LDCSILNNVNKSKRIIDLLTKLLDNSVYESDIPVITRFRHVGVPSESSIISTLYHYGLLSYTPNSYNLTATNDTARKILLGFIVPHTQQIAASIHLYFPDYPASYVNIGSPKKLNISGKISIMAWILSEGYSELRNIFGRYDGSHEVYFRINSGTYQVGSWQPDHLASTAISPEDMGKWVHLCGTYDGEYWNLYKNGIKIVRSQRKVGAVLVNNSWLIGAFGAGNERFFKGFIKDVNIWNIAVDNDTVKRTMQGDISMSESGLVGFWRLSEAEGQIVYDSTNNPANGSIVQCQWKSISD